MSNSKETLDLSKDEIISTETVEELSNNKGDDDE